MELAKQIFWTMLFGLLLMTFGGLTLGIVVGCKSGLLEHAPDYLFSEHFVFLEGVDACVESTFSNLLQLVIL